MKISCDMQVRLANYLDSWRAPDNDGSLAPEVRKLVRDGVGRPVQALGARPDFAFGSDDNPSPTSDDVCQQIPGVTATHSQPSGESDVALRVM
jgi:hypothetical protein